MIMHIRPTLYTSSCHREPLSIISEENEEGEIERRPSSPLPLSSLLFAKYASVIRRSPPPTRNIISKDRYTVRTHSEDVRRKSDFAFAGPSVQRG